MSFLAKDNVYLYADWVDVTEILIVTGENGPETIDLANSTTTNGSSCPIDYPVDAYSATGGLLNSKHGVICGGIDLNGYGKLSACYKIGNDDPIAYMKQERSVFASVVWSNKGHQDVLWVTGGRYHNECASISTEYVTLDSNQTTYGPDLPMALSGHCLVKLDSENVLLVGGKRSEKWNDVTGSGTLNTNKSFFYSTKTSRWLNGSDLLSARTQHACGMVVDLVTKDKVVVVIGGYGDGKSIFSSSNQTELLFLNDSPMLWQNGTPLPSTEEGLAGQGVTTASNEMFILLALRSYFGEDDLHRSIYSFQSRNRIGKWSLLPQKLQVERFFPAVAFLIPHNYCFVDFSQFSK